ncbi:MAG: MotA/TolQ/ExbB proton channel family protein [Fusobacteriaceae bacterium]
MYWLKNGGPLMYFIVAMSVIGIAVIIERAIYFRTSESKSFIKIRIMLKQHIEKKEIKEAVILLNSNKSSSSRVIKEILTFWYRTNTTNVVSLEEKAREAGLAQIPSLERNMWLLGLVAHATPLLGLLGTVTGMIEAFQAVSTHGTGDPSVLAKGISEALLTTAGGLIVAIPALICYNYFNKKIDNVINEMEKTSTEIINIFRK